MASLSSKDFDKLEAYDRVLPLDHTERMLGFIAWMLAKYLDLKTDDDDGLEKMCMPWMPEHRAEVNPLSSLLPKEK